MQEHTDKTVLDILDRTVEGVVRILDACRPSVYADWGDRRVFIRSLRGGLLVAFRQAFYSDEKDEHVIHRAMFVLWVSLAGSGVDCSTLGSCERVIEYGVRTARQMRVERKRKMQEELEKKIASMHLHLPDDDDEGFPPPPQNTLRPKQKRRDPFEEFLAVFDL